MYKQLYNLLETVTDNTNWNDIKADGKQARAVFTTICLMFDYEADTAATDGILQKLYCEYIEGIYNISYATFENYMIEDIV